MNVIKILLTAILLLSLRETQAQRFKSEFPYNQMLTYHDFWETSEDYVVSSNINNTLQTANLAVKKAGYSGVFTTQNMAISAIGSEKSIRLADSSFFVYNVGVRLDSSYVIFYNRDLALQGLRNIPHLSDSTEISLYGGFTDAIKLQDGFLLVGRLEAIYSGGIYKHFLYAVRVDMLGNVIWQSRKEVLDDEVGYMHQLIAGTNKAFFSWYYEANGVGVQYVSAIRYDGRWEIDPEITPNNSNIIDIAPRNGGGMVCVGHRYGNFFPNDFFGSAYCYDENFNLLWEKRGWPELNALAKIDFGGHYFVPLIVQDGDNYVISGVLNIPSGTPNSTYPNIFQARLNPGGDIIALTVSRIQGSNAIKSLHKTSDSGFLTTYETSLWPNEYNVGLLKSDSNLVYATNQISGQIFQDHSLNCEKDSTENGLEGWIVAIYGQNTSDLTFAGLNGKYEFAVDTGIYTLAVTPFNQYWEDCQGSQTVHFSDFYTADTLDFAMQPEVECVQLEVNVALPFTRRCFDNTMYVGFCNNGTISATNPQIHLALDPDLDYIASEIAPTAIVGDTLIFDLPPLAVNECGQFWVHVNPNCDSTELGQTVCVSAKILPDSFCLPEPNWSGAQVISGGSCQGDSILFWAKNVGNATSQALEYVIIEDMVVWREDVMQPLQINETREIRLAANGSAFGFLMEQEPDYPYNGNSPLANGTAAWVEGCNAMSGGGNFGGFPTQFPNEDGDPTVSFECGVLVGSYDPNDKSCLPAGVNDAHFILPATPLEYLIRFQNTGTDTAFTVVIRDNLSEFLDPLTLDLKTTSHACKMTFDPGNVLRFTFDNILLPDSNTNFAASNGFVKFSILPKTNIPMGSRIENTAAIYFDFNPPVITNTTWHTVDTNFLKQLPTAVFENEHSASHTQILAPNPAKSGGTVWLPNQENFSGNARLSVAFGRDYGTFRVQNGRFVLKQDLLPGHYFVEIIGVGTYKLLIL